MSDSTTPVVVDPLDALTAEERYLVAFLGYMSISEARDAVDCIRRLAAELTVARAELARRDEADRWIPVTEKPTAFGRYLCRDVYGPTEADIEFILKRFSPHGGWLGGKSAMTHYRPLPAPPAP